MYVLFSLLQIRWAGRLGVVSCRAGGGHSRCGERSFWICALPVEVGGSPRRGSVFRQQPGRLSRELGQAP